MILLLFLSFAIVGGEECIERRRLRDSLGQFKEARHRNAEKRRSLYLNNATLTTTFAGEPRLLWYLVQPDYSCEDTALIGNQFKDGAKYVCNLHWLMRQSEPCTYYSFGVNGEIGFEEEFVDLLPDCEMHAFDPTPSVVNGPSRARLNDLGVEFHAIGLSDTNANIRLENTDVPVRTLDYVRAMLGHADAPITILKIDIEMWEWPTLKQQLRNCERDKPMAHQILVEFHYFPWVIGDWDNRIDLLYEHLHNCGYRCFVKDANHHCPNCVEYGFVHEQFLHCRQ